MWAWDTDVCVWAWWISKYCCLIYRLGQWNGENSLYWALLAATHILPGIWMKSGIYCAPSTYQAPPILISIIYKVENKVEKESDYGGP